MVQDPPYKPIYLHEDGMEAYSASIPTCVNYTLSILLSLRHQLSNGLQPVLSGGQSGRCAPVTLWSCRLPSFKSPPSSISGKRAQSVSMCGSWQATCWRSVIAAVVVGSPFDPPSKPLMIHRRKR